jgi:ABC-2 type transport system ATP-binding protein
MKDHLREAPQNKNSNVKKSYVDVFVLRSYNRTKDTSCNLSFTYVKLCCYAKFMKINAIEVKKVTKKFGKTVVLNGVSMSAEKGKVTGLLGPNGAGKSTLIKIMTTLLSLDGGQVLIDGVDVEKDPKSAREHIGLTGQFAAVDDFLTGRETLIMIGSLYGLGRSEARSRADELLAKLDLTEAGSKLIKNYSGGMRRRLDLGASLVATPQVLFLDEPTTGLDPRTRLQLWDIIRDLVAQGVTILLTTQYLEEADALCDYIYLIDDGKVLVEGTAGELKSNLGEDVIELKVADEHLEKTQLEINKVMGSEPTVDTATRRLIVKTTNGSDDLLTIASALKKTGVKAEELSLHRPSLDEVFLKLTNKNKTKGAKS